jgi:hypothetical protein
VTTYSPPPRTSFVEEVLGLYRSLPDTPDHPQRSDRLLAAELERNQVPLPLVRAALLLGTARRCSGRRRLPPVRSLHYFLPVIEEIRHDPPDPAYLTYLEQRLSATIVGCQPRISPTSRGFS